MKTLISFLVCCSAISFAANKPQAPSAQLAWAAPTQGCAVSCTYNIYRGPTSGNETLLTSGVVPLSYSDTTVTRGNFYCYEITAVNTAGESPKSNEICGTDPTVPTAPSGLTVQFQ
jgi:fibronectin type 3 domain-containing protein